MQSLRSLKVKWSMRLSVIGCQRVDVTEVHWAHFVVIFVLKKGGGKRKMAGKFYYVFFHQSELRYGTTSFKSFLPSFLDFFLSQGGPFFFPDRQDLHPPSESIYF